MVDLITLQHVGFAFGVVGILLATKALFDIAESAKHIARYYLIVCADEDESPASAGAPAAPSAQTIGEVGAAHVNPDIMTKPPQGSVTVTTLNYGAST